MFLKSPPPQKNGSAKEGKIINRKFCVGPFAITAKGKPTICYNVQNYT